MNGYSLAWCDLSLLTALRALTDEIDVRPEAYHIGSRTRDEGPT